MVEQLNPMSARISLLFLLMNYEPHHNALMRVLNEAYMALNISMGRITHLVGNIVAYNHITFNNDEIPSKGKGSIKALYITTVDTLFCMRNFYFILFLLPFVFLYSYILIMYVYIYIYF